jgi:hypothetical protein
MNDAPTHTAQAAEEAVAALLESMTEDAMKVAADALAVSIGACSDADSVERLLDQPAIGAMFGNGVGALPLWSAVIGAMVSLAEALSQPGDAVRVLGWARWTGAPAPIGLVRPDLFPTLRPALREAGMPAFEAQAPLYRRWLCDASAERRAAAAHALAWCRGVTLADVDLLVGHATTELDGAALGSTLVTLGVLIHRFGSESESTRRLALQTLDHPDAFARACAATAQALTGATLSARATQALTDVVQSPVHLPVGWGWRASRSVAYESNALACAVLNWAATCAAEDAVCALARVALPYDAAGSAKLEQIRTHLGEDAWREAASLRPQHHGPAEALLAGALAHLGFEARGRPAPAYGLVASELDPTQRLALEAMSRRAPEAEHAWPRVGLHAKRNEDIVPAFLEGRTAEWRPIAIEIAGQQRHVHFGPLWSATVSAAVSVAAATRAIHAAMTPAEAVDLVTRFTGSRMPGYEQMSDSPFGWQRDQELALAVIDGAVVRGFDLDEMMKAVAANRRSGLPAIAAIAYLRSHPDNVPPEYQKVIDDGAAQTRVAEPLGSLVAQLRAAQR